jgi:hypothetical protein
MMAQFCLIQDLKDRNAEIVKNPTVFTDPVLTTIVEDVSRWIQGLLYNGQSVVPDMPDTPGPIHDLAIYAAMEELLIRGYSSFREADAEDIQFWNKRLVKQLKGILSHRISSPDMVQPEISSNKEDVRLYPAFGLGPFGERVLTDSLPDAETGYETRFVGGEWGETEEV